MTGEGENTNSSQDLEEIREKIRNKYRDIIYDSPHVPTERAITFQKLDELGTDVRQYSPVNHTNPRPEKEIGRYRSFDKRKCVTADMEIIRDMAFILKKEPPSFLEAGPREKLFFSPEKKLKVGILTSGGIAPGLNTVIHAIVNMHEKVYHIATDIIGFYCGFEGIEERRFKENLKAQNTINWIHRGGSFLFSFRGEKGSEDDKKKALDKIITSLYELNLDILYVIGGDGSLSFAHEIAEIIWDNVEKDKRKIVVAGIPKTMDNDILWVWHSFGFNTAVGEATRTINAIYDDVRSSQRIGLVQLFGRDAGFVAAHATLASGLVDAVLVPEVGFRIKPLLEYVETKVSNKKYALIVIAEGAKPEDFSKETIKEKLINEGINVDDETNPLVRQRLSQWNLEVITDKFKEHFVKYSDGRHKISVIQPRYLIRAVSPNSIDQIFCQRLSDLVVHNALAGYTDFMVSQWLTEYVLVPLKLVAGQIDPDTNKRQAKGIPPNGIFWKTVIASTGQPSFE